MLKNVFRIASILFLIGAPLIAVFFSSSTVSADDVFFCEKATFPPEGSGRYLEYKPAVEGACQTQWAGQVLHTGDEPIPMCFDPNATEVRDRFVIGRSGCIGDLQNAGVYSHSEGVAAIRPSLDERCEGELIELPSGDFICQIDDTGELCPIGDVVDGDKCIPRTPCVEEGPNLPNCIPQDPDPVIGNPGESGRPTEPNPGICDNSNDSGRSEGLTECDCTETPLTSDNCDIVKYVNAGINIASGVAGLAILGGAVYGSYLYMTARDNPGQVQAGKERIAWALIAAGIFSMTYAFLQWVVPGGVL